MRVFNKTKYCMLFLSSLALYAGAANAQTEELSEIEPAADLVAEEIAVQSDIDEEIQTVDSNDSTTNDSVYYPPEPVIFYPPAPVAAAMAVPVSSGSKCGSLFNQCLRLTGAPNQEIYVVLVSTFSNYATQNYTKSFDAARGISKLIQYGKNVEIIDSGGIVFHQLNQLSQYYWLIPKCGTKIQWKSRIKVILSLNLELSREIKCQN